MFPLLSRVATATVVVLLPVISLTTFAGCSAQPTEYRAGPRNTIPVRDQPRSAAEHQDRTAALESRDKHSCMRTDRPKHVVRICE
jgi:uncharacterized lipoprotein YajG